MPRLSLLFDLADDTTDVSCQELCTRYITDYLAIEECFPSLSLALDLVRKTGALFWFTVGSTPLKEFLRTRWVGPHEIPFEVLGAVDDIGID